MTCARTHRAEPAAGLCPSRAFGSSSAPPIQPQSSDSGTHPWPRARLPGRGAFCGTWNKTGLRDWQAGRRQHCRRKGFCSVVGLADSISCGCPRCPALGSQRGLRDKPPSKTRRKEKETERVDREHRSGSGCAVLDRVIR